MYPQSMFKNFHFYYREKSLYIAWTCFRNVVFGTECINDGSWEIQDDVQDVHKHNQSPHAYIFNIFSNTISPFLRKQICASFLKHYFTSITQKAQKLSNTFLQVWNLAFVYLFSS